VDATWWVLGTSLVYGLIINYLIKCQDICKNLILDVRQLRGVIFFGELGGNIMVNKSTEFGNNSTSI